MAKYLSFFVTKLTLQVTRFLAFNDEERMNGYLKRKLVSQVDEIIELHKAGFRARRSKLDEKQSRYSPFIAKACKEGSFQGSRCCRLRLGDSFCDESMYRRVEDKLLKTVALLCRPRAAVRREYMSPAYYTNEAMYAAVSIFICYIMKTNKSSVQN